MEGSRRDEARTLHDPPSLTPRQQHDRLVDALADLIEAWAEGRWDEVDQRRFRAAALGLPLPAADRPVGGLPIFAEKRARDPPSPRMPPLADHVPIRPGPLSRVRRAR